MSKTDNAAVPAPRRGRRPGTSASRQAIHEAARARFAKDGYAATTIRKVAADVGVDAALVMQFYRSKDELFAAVMSLSPLALSRFAKAFENPDDTIGERIARSFLGVWEGQAEDAEPLLAMLRGAISNETAATQLQDFIQTRLVEEISPKLGGDQAATLRAGLVSAMLIGVIVGRQVVRVPALAEADRETVIQTLAPALQTVLMGQQGPS